MGMALVLTTYGSMEDARKISGRMVRGGAAACATIVRCDSIYEWEGSVRDEPEYMVLYKTADAGAAALMAEVARTHPYDTPEIVRIPVSDVHPPYMAWLAGQAR